MACHTWLDHVWGYEIIVGTSCHPLTGQTLLRVERRCDHCDQVQRSTRPGHEAPAYPPERRTVVA